LTAKAPRAWQRMLSGRGSICSTPHRLTSKSATLPMALHALRDGTGRPRAIMPSPLPSTALSSRTSSAGSTGHARGMPDGVAARCAGICDRRHDLTVQVGGRGRLQAVEKRLEAAIHLRFGLPPHPARAERQDQKGRQDRRLLRGVGTRRVFSARKPRSSSASRAASPGRCCGSIPCRRSRRSGSSASVSTALERVRAYMMSAIIVAPLARIAEMAVRHGAREMISLMAKEQTFHRPR
jgi:hypothetical protein